MTNEIETRAFDYSLVPEESRDLIKTKTAETKILVRQTAQGIIEIGKNLIEVKQSIGHGNWLPWLEAEFGWSQRTAYNFMGVADKFKFATVANLDIAPKALYLLAQNSTPDEVRETAVTMAEAGIPVTAKVSKELKEIKAENERLQAELDKAKEPDLNNLIPELKARSGGRSPGRAGL